MKSNQLLTAEERKGNKSFAEMYPAPSCRPARPVLVFQGTKRYQEAEEEE